MKIMVAGAGGILGRELVHGYLSKGHHVTAMVLSRDELKGTTHANLKIVEANVTRPETIHGACDGMDRVLSCVGITRIKGRVTHDDVDWKGNLNLLREAERAKVGKFGFISPAGTAEGHHHVPLLSAKHRFEKALSASGVPWVIFRSGGFFSDLAEMKKMAAKGPLFVIGGGRSKSTPIAVSDLARVMAEHMETKHNEIVEVGGPEDLTWQDICRTCFEVNQRPARITNIPVWVCQLTLAFIKPFSYRHFAMGKLLLFMSTRDVCTPHMGTTRLRDYMAGRGV